MKLKKERVFDLARKNKNLATSFNNVAGNENNNTNINVNINSDKNDFVQSVIGNSDNHEDKYVLRGIYIEKDLVQIIDQLAKKGGRGTKSRIVNEALRKVFVENGLIES